MTSSQQSSPSPCCRRRGAGDGTTGRTAGPPRRGPTRPRATAEQPLGAGRGSPTWSWSTGSRPTTGSRTAATGAGRPGRDAAAPRHLARHPRRQEARDRELRWLDGLVGGRAALLALDVRPLVTRPVDLGALPADLRHRAAGRQRRVRPVGDRGVRRRRAGRRRLGTCSKPPWPPTRGCSSAAPATTPPPARWCGPSDRRTGSSGRRVRSWPGTCGRRLGIPPSAAGRGAAMLERLAPGADLLVPPAGAPRLRATGLPGALVAATRSLLVARRDQALGTAG